jgi:murein DD-endopeptidase MepM/ murein hydrolase activator NlpD
VPRAEGEAGAQLPNDYRSVWAYVHAKREGEKRGYGEKEGVIAAIGNYRWLTGPHLHFDLLKYGIRPTRCRISAENIQRRNPGK